MPHPGPAGTPECALATSPLTKPSGVPYLRNGPARVFHATAGRSSVRYTTRIIVPPRVRRSGAPGGVGVGPRPQAIGVRKSLGFGDPLGHAGSGHVAVAAAHPEFVPFFAQAIPAELAASRRTLTETLATAARGVGAGRFRQPWGADADGLRTPQDVDDAAAAGYPYFTINLAEHVRDAALSPDELTVAVDRMVADGELPEDWSAPYLDREVALGDGTSLLLTLAPLQRAAVRFGHAIQHGARMYETAARANRGRPYEVEVSLDGVGAPTTTVEHLYLGLELEARGVRLTSLALRPEGSDPTAFEAALREHVAVASFCGPYKLSFRGERYDEAFVPAIGRCCGDLLHFKTSAESFHEALRLAWRVEPNLLREAATAGGLPLTDGVDLEAEYLGHPEGARALASACATLAAPGNEAFLALLERHADLYHELLDARFERLIRALNAG